MNADRAREIADRIIKAPGRSWDALTDPVYPERVGAVIVLTLITGALFTGSQSGWWLVAIYIYLDVAVTTARRVRRWRAARREAKQATAPDKSKGILGDVTRNGA